MDKGEAFTRYEADSELKATFAESERPTDANGVNITNFNTKVMKFDVFEEIKAQSDGSTKLLQNLNATLDTQLNLEDADSAANETEINSLDDTKLKKAFDLVNRHMMSSDLRTPKKVPLRTEGGALKVPDEDDDTQNVDFSLEENSKYQFDFKTKLFRNGKEVPSKEVDDPDVTVEGAAGAYTVVDKPGTLYKKDGETYTEITFNEDGTLANYTDGDTLVWRYKEFKVGLAGNDSFKIDKEGVVKRLKLEKTETEMTVIDSNNKSKIIPRVRSMVATRKLKDQSQTEAG